MGSRLALLLAAVVTLVRRRGIGLRRGGRRPEQSLSKGLEHELDLARIDPLALRLGLVLEPLELLVEPLRSALVLVAFAGQLLTLVEEDVAFSRRRREVLLERSDALHRDDLGTRDA